MSTTPLNKGSSLNSRWFPPAPPPGTLGNKAVLSWSERVVLVHGLREVTALAGFTRFEPASTDETGELAGSGRDRGPALADKLVGLA